MCFLKNMYPLNDNFWNCTKYPLQIYFCKSIVYHSTFLGKLMNTVEPVYAFEVLIVGTMCVKIGETLPIGAPR